MVTTSNMTPPPIDRDNPSLTEEALLETYNRMNQYASVQASGYYYVDGGAGSSGPIGYVGYNHPIIGRVQSTGPIGGIDRPAEQDWDDDSNEPEESVIDYGTIEPNSGTTFSSTSFTYEPSTEANVDIRLRDTSIPYMEYPLSFDFSGATWGYVFKFILSMIFAPVMIIASKVLGKKIGIR